MRHRKPADATEATHQPGPMEASEADVAEQRREIAVDPTADEQPEQADDLTTVEADLADAAEQRQVVPIEDDPQP
jgi:hypothetical protein